MLRGLAIRIVLVAAPFGCELVTEPLLAIGLDSGPAGIDSGSLDSGGLDGSESGLDSAPCVDADWDGACADRDCDDSDIRRSPDFREFCVDHIDNDCDNLVDFDDACDLTNDRCEQEFAVLRQWDRPQTVWVFDGLRLDIRYADDYQAAFSSAFSETCGPESGLGGGDAIFRIEATFASDLDVTANGGPASDPVLYLRELCDSQESDLCSDGNGGRAQIQTTLRAGDMRYLFVDENRAGPVDLRVELTRL